MLHLDSLHQMIDNVLIVDEFQPTEKVSLDERVVGEMTEEMKKICVLRAQADQKIRDAIADSISSRNPIDDDPAAMKEIIRTKALFELLNDLLWYTIHSEFDLWGSEVEGVGMRENWKIVTFSRSSDNIMDFLSGLGRI
jgi:hypothetical protein